MLLTTLRYICLFLPILLYTLTSYQAHPSQAFFLLFSFIGNGVVEFLHIHHVWLVSSIHCRNSMHFHHCLYGIRARHTIWKVFVSPPSFLELSIRIRFLLRMYIATVFSWYGPWEMPSFARPSTESSPSSSSPPLFDSFPRPIPSLSCFCFRDGW